MCGFTPAERGEDWPVTGVGMAFVLGDSDFGVLMDSQE